MPTSIPWEVLDLIATILDPKTLATASSVSKTCHPTTFGNTSPPLTSHPHPPDPFHHRPILPLPPPLQPRLHIHQTPSTTAVKTSNPPPKPPLHHNPHHLKFASGHRNKTRDRAFARPDRVVSVRYRCSGSRKVVKIRGVG
ncbi:hypothetical protein L1987_04330 [Smallanthus sonchifolius]|uniref:Uncharacterized protein n=1 Tax=Smallanthus sonchifolius TaxID=185202 RepID=A0ACB9KD32_9ASTR|nr:hypothetical protein L1987_04330 [Smallanthus sonchifolius]